MTSHLTAQGPTARYPDDTPSPKVVPPANRKRRRRARAHDRPGPLAYGFLVLVLLAAAFPFYWTILIASGDASTINQSDMSWIPGSNFFDNVMTVLQNDSVGFWNALRNSIIVSTTVAASVVIFSTMAGYSFAMLRFRGSTALLAFVIATMAVPMQLGIVPLFIAMSSLQLAGTLWAVIIPGMVTAFGVFWMTQYIRQALPYELIEAARVDGASMFRTFWSIALPAARPAASMLGLFVFIASWTDFFWPFIVLDRQNPTLTVALSLLQGSYFVDYSVVLAGVILSVIPLFILFIVAGKQLVNGIMQGAVKG